MNKMKLSIIIPSFKRAQLLKWGLFSLTKQTTSFAYEVIVLNEGIEDDTQKTCNQYKDKLNIRYVFTGQRNKNGIKWRIPGYAINIGAKLAKGEIIIIACPEIFIVDNCLQQMVDIVSNNKNLITRTYGLDDNKGVILKHIEKTGGILPKQIPQLPTLQTHLPFFMAINKEKFISIGGYDEDFVGVCYDDNDIIDRLKQNGCSLHQINAKIIHLYHPRLRYGNEDVRKLLNLNKKIYEDRRGIMIRNKNKDWGKL